MSKITFLLFILFGFLFIYPKIYGEVQAAPTLTVSPTQLTNRDTQGIDITATNLIPDERYAITIQGSNHNEIPLKPWENADANGTISFHLCKPEPGGIKTPCGNDTFQEDVYTLNLYEGIFDTHPGAHGQQLTRASFNVIVKTAGTIEFTNTRFTTADNITVKVNNLTDGSYLVWVDYKDPQHKEEITACIDTTGGSFNYNLGHYYEGKHDVQIYTNKKDVTHPQCGIGSLVTYGCFTVNNAASGGPCSSTGVGTTSAPTTVIIKQCVSNDDPRKTDAIHYAVCASGGGESCDTKDNRGPAFKTAIGCIHTNPVEFVKDLMKFVIGIGGGLAFLMMLLGAYQMLSSGGNPETLKAGQDRLTSAVIGLLFIIFSILLLQIIGVGILAIPGFK